MLPEGWTSLPVAGEGARSAGAGKRGECAMQGETGTGNRWDGATVRGKKEGEYIGKWGGGRTVSCHWGPCLSFLYPSTLLFSIGQPEPLL